MQDGSKNCENFFLDVEGELGGVEDNSYGSPVAKEEDEEGEEEGSRGGVPVSVGGLFTFIIYCEERPFRIEIPLSRKYSLLSELRRSVETEFDNESSAITIARAMSIITDKYVDLADDIEEQLIGLGSTATPAAEEEYMFCNRAGMMDRTIGGGATLGGGGAFFGSGGVGRLMVEESGDFALTGTMEVGTGHFGASRNTNANSTLTATFGSTGSSTQGSRFGKHSKDAFNEGTLSKGAVDRILCDYGRLCDTETEANGFSAHPVGRDLSSWTIELFGFDDKGIAGQLKLWAAAKRRQLDAEAGGLLQDVKECVTLSMKFPPDYPFSPPFVHIVSPRMVANESPFVFEGGAICAQILTSDGWTPTNDIESLIVSLRALLTAPPRSKRRPAAAAGEGEGNNNNGEGMGGGLCVDLGNLDPYDEATARKSFRGLVLFHEKHGWGKK